MNRRSFLFGLAGAASASILPLDLFAAQTSDPGFRLVDVTSAAGIQFQHNGAAYGGKLLPETLGSGCAFLDYDCDGWQDILLINGTDWPGHKQQTSTLQLYRNNRDGTFADVTERSGMGRAVWASGVTVADYDNVRVRCGWVLAWPALLERLHHRAWFRLTSSRCY